MDCPHGYNFARELPAGSLFCRAEESNRARDAAELLKDGQQQLATQPRAAHDGCDTKILDALAKARRRHPATITIIG